MHFDPGLRASSQSVVHVASVCSESFINSDSDQHLLRIHELGQRLQCDPQVVVFPLCDVACELEPQI